MLLMEGGLRWQRKRVVLAVVLVLIVVRLIVVGLIVFTVEARRVGNGLGQQMWGRA